MPYTYDLEYSSYGVTIEGIGKEYVSDTELCEDLSDTQDDNK